MPRKVDSSSKENTERSNGASGWLPKWRWRGAGQSEGPQGTEELPENLVEAPPTWERQPQPQPQPQSQAQSPPSANVVRKELQPFAPQCSKENELLKTMPCHSEARLWPMVDPNSDGMPTRLKMVRNVGIGQSVSDSVSGTAQGETRALLSPAECRLDELTRRVLRFQGGARLLGDQSTRRHLSRVVQSPTRLLY